MQHIFISHAGEDSEIANRFHTDLRNAGHEAIIDLCELSLGTNSIKFVNEGISDAHTIVILFSKNTPTAAWQNVEIDAAFWNEIQQGGGRCIVIRLDDTDLPPLLGPKIFNTLLPNQSNYTEILENLCQAVLPSQTASSVVAAAFQHEARNPFRRVRAEFFEDFPKLLAESFAPPDAMKMGALEEMKPCLLEGPRGTGKSMLLLALRARNLASRSGKVSLHDIFGFYLKLTRGAVCNAGIAGDAGSDPPSLDTANIAQITDAFSQEIVLCLLESLLSELSTCIHAGHLSCDAKAERAIVGDIHQLLYRSAKDRPPSIAELQKLMAEMHRGLAEFIRRRFIYNEQVSVPVATLDLTAFKQAISCVKSIVPGLSRSLFMVLFDEYENLFPFQQKVINGFVKLAAPDFTVKIAKKLGIADVSGTTTGQELQEIHDYNRVNLVYDVEDSQHFSSYSRLVEEITSKLLRNAELEYRNMSFFLPDDHSPEVSAGEHIRELALLHKMTVEEFLALPSREQEAKRQYYREAATYRVLYGRGGRQKDKRFSGFRDLAFLSSGVIRYFLEFLGVAYHIQYDGQGTASQPPQLSPDAQTKAVHTVSSHYLTTLSRNVENDGERLKYYVLDLSDCLRHKLLTHGSEPEAGRITIVNPEAIESPAFAELRRLLQLGVREGVFQGREGRPAFKPKHRSDPQPAEINICRIYSPVLQISPRLRWRTNIACEDLLGLWDPKTRRTTKASLIRKLVRSTTHPKLGLGGHTP